MIKMLFVSAALLALAAPAAAQTIETGRADWDEFPAAKKKLRPLDVSLLTDLTERLLASGQCQVPGMSPKKFDVDISYAALIEPNGTVKRIVMEETGCATLNGLVGGIIYDWAQRGDFRPTGQREPLWFGDRITFARE